jgi:ArsR family transcriptional regulator
MNSHYCDMDTASAVALMAMLGHRLRIEIWRALLPYKSGGLGAGVISAQMDIAPSSLSFHLQQMVKAGLLALRHDGRYTIYSVNTENIVALCDYLANAVGNTDQPASSPMGDEVLLPSPPCRSSMVGRFSSSNGRIMTQAQIYWARAQRWRQVAETATSAKIRAAYVELAVAYERLATLETQAGDGSSRPVAIEHAQVGPAHEN